MRARQRDPVALLADLRARYGDVARIRVGDTNQFLISDLAGVKHVLVENQRNYTKGPGYRLLAQVLGGGLITGEGEDWKRHRRLVQPSLQREQMAGFIAVMAAEAEAAARALERAAGTREPVDVFPLMMDMALRVVSHTVLGTEIRGAERDIHDAITEVLDHIERLSTSKLRFLEILPGGSRLRGWRARVSALSTRRQRAFQRAVRGLDSLIYGVIERRSRDELAEPSGADLVSLLLRARGGSDGDALTDAEIRDEVMTMFIAGHETTATALTWALYLIAVHPDHQTRIASEAATVLGSLPFGLGDLGALTCAQNVFAETMRLYPPVWRISRFATGADVVAGYDVPAGSVVLVSPYVIHHDERYWPEPTRFDPERFRAGVASSRPKLAYLPFGAGPRMCIGAAFATAEAQIALSAICRAVHLDPARESAPNFEPRVTLRPAGGMPLRVTSRTAAHDSHEARR